MKIRHLHEDYLKISIESLGRAFVNSLLINQKQFYEKILRGESHLIEKPLDRKALAEINKRLKRLSKRRTKKRPSIHS